MGRLGVIFFVGLFLLSATFNPLINVREIPQREVSEGDKPFMLVSSTVFIPFPLYFLITIRERWKAFVKVLLLRKRCYLNVTKSEHMV